MSSLSSAVSDKVADMSAMSIAQALPPAQQPPIVPPSQYNPFAGFDPHAGTNWLYPIDFTSPEYLPLITEKTLYHNSLAILPNKFEKTFVTAVAMYNVYRWYPLGKVVFIAPKRNLVSDQMSACERLMKFQSADVVEMVMKPHDRPRFWMSKRVFFISSYMMLCDVNRAAEERMMMDRVKLVVIDEPQAENRLHTKILQKLAEFNQNFRILCVSTTSSKTVDAGLLKQWFISNIELQWGNPQETPEDWLMNKKEISNISTPINPSLSALLAELRDLGQRYTKNLHVSKTICKAEFESVEIEQIKQERSKYELGILTGVMRKNHHDIMLNFHLAEKIIVGYRTLQRDGIVSLLEYFTRQNDVLLQNDQKLVDFLHKLQQGAYNTPHPKFRTLENFLREFFQRRSDAKVLIVVEHLDVALVINKCLQVIPECKHKVLIDANYAQDIDMYCKSQLNVLIVTISIEPAIDIGETDLIILFNMTDNPRKFLAHIARTRGKKHGAIVILTTEGAEQQEVDEVIHTRPKRKANFLQRSTLD
ncbi:Fanconi anemia group M protein-like isoform X2 [Topomyia yanbarensis]|uniref:Fanconi anemia group M protein-like isoform X2 n=1 Tax=Topomyia yanbarensis TaxID=2498891 RepID=UPI00273BF209|nr:Fanconi anemia group M protein-like isoform X2 [Topomyia yanbarensis]